MLLIHVWLLLFDMGPSFVELLVHVWLLPFGMGPSFVVLLVLIDGWLRMGLLPP